MFDHSPWWLASEVECGSPDSPTSVGARFLSEVQDSCSEAWGYSVGEWRSETDVDAWAGDAIHEIADGCVPVYTHEMWQTFTDLAAYEYDHDYAGPTDDPGVQASGALYAIAYDLARQLISEATAEWVKVSTLND